MLATERKLSSEQLAMTAALVGQVTKVTQREGASNPICIMGWFENGEFMVEKTMAPNNILVFRQVIDRMVMELLKVVNDPHFARLGLPEEEQDE